MGNINPFGTNSASGTPNVGVQQFCGALVSSFSCSADFSSQGGSLNVVLIEDDVNNYRFVAPVISQPVHFGIEDLDGNTVFEFDGVVDAISRRTGSDGKVYEVAVSSPLKILSAVSIITDTYAGYGFTSEGLPQYFSSDGYYNISTSPDGYLPDGVSKVPSGDYYQVGNLQFATNNSNLNYTGMLAKQYNIINVFGAFENSQYGIVNFRGFGASAESPEGMTLDRVCYALDSLINATSSSDGQRYLGGNILFGTNTYNICSTAFGYTAPNPYYYGFDAIGFYNQVVPYLGAGYRIKGPISLLDMITQVCEEINADFQINLDVVSYTIGTATDYENLTHSVYSAGTFSLEKTYPASVLGGVIWVQVVPRNTYVNCNRPFSDIAYNLISLEQPNFGGYGTESEINPGIPGTGFLNPLDSDYTETGTRGSTPYGGKFPVSTSNDSTGASLSDHLNRASSVNVSVKATDSTTAKLVVGGFQTRMVNVPRDYIYQYWGDIKIEPTGSQCTTTRSSAKTIPVVTQILPPNDIVDMIMIDIADIIPRSVDMWNTEYWKKMILDPRFGDIDVIKNFYGNTNPLNQGDNVTTQYPFYSGVYFASVAEIRAAMQSVDEWENYLTYVKQKKLACMQGFLRGYAEKKSNEISQFYTQLKNSNPNSVATKQFAIKDQDNESVYTGFREKLAVRIDMEPFDEQDSEDIFIAIGEKVKKIGDTHYGQSWMAPIPFFTTKITEDNNTLIGNYVRSWDLTDSAYVEPDLYLDIDAPFDSSFISDGKLLPFANFEYYMTGNSLGYDLFTDSIIGFDPDGTNNFDFSEIDENSLVIDATGCYPQPLVHLAPSLDNKYTFIPCNYFTLYNRYNAPFFEVTANTSTSDTAGVVRVNSIYGATYSYDSVLRTGIMPTGSLNDCGNSAGIAGAVFVNPNDFNTLSSTGVLATGYNNFYVQFPTAAITNMTRNIMTTRFDDNGLNGLPFVKFTTPRVKYPNNKDSGVSINDNNFHIVLGLMSMGYTEDEARTYISKRPAALADVNAVKDFELFQPILPPRSVCIPQISNRFVYGPWLTSYNVLYCGRVEVEIDESIRPENYIIPNYGSITMAGGSYSSGILSQTSGFAGMNIAGQAKANSIDNFSLFAQEEGTIVIPGLPMISKIGQNLLNGPRITDIQVSIQQDSVATTYNFRQNSPRLGRTNRDIIKRLNKITATIKRLG